MTEIALTAVVFDEAIYPRAEWSQTTVNRYVEALAAGDKFPPIALESGTRRLLDGMHRARAHQQAEREAIEVEYHDIPAGVPAKLYAASLSARHGDRIDRDDLVAMTREILEANPDYDLKTIAKYVGVTRQTVSKWGGDIPERRREVRRVKALLLSRAGWSYPRIGEFLGVDQKTAWNDVNADISPSLAEDLLREAAEDLPIDADAIVEEIRQERIFAQWTDGERGLLKRLRDGQTVAVNQKTHANLIGWAESAGLYERIDRRSPWGNPFELPGDGDRETVIRNYAAHFIPFKPSLLQKVNGLQGKALGCWCAPDLCHGDVLATLADSDGDQRPALQDTLTDLVAAAGSLPWPDFAKHIGGPA